MLVLLIPLATRILHRLLALTCRMMRAVTQTPTQTQRQTDKKKGDTSTRSYMKQRQKNNPQKQYQRSDDMDEGKIQ